MDLGLNDVHVLITGASGGIGLETTRLYLSLGARVTAHYNRNPKPLHDLCTHHETTLRCIQANLTNEDDVTRLFDQASDNAHVPVSVLVVNHGVWPEEDVPLADMSLQQWNNTIGVNLTASFLVCRGYLRALRKAGESEKAKASIVLVGSTSGKYGEPGHADYAVTKSGMMYGLTNSLENEIVRIAPKGRVNAVAPGWVKTAMTEETFKDPMLLYPDLATTPLRKVATAMDVANQIVILSSHAVSGHVSGQVVFVDGGQEGTLLNMPEDLPSDL
ncbi:NAD(P)-binding protein [Coniophora puteana RWD-64-598 SS2]|uniref:NAD(P)-binding protein n=1 Tax=Coniophora puteana (strain RWD-64-598) TaxID=741705 RepID=A0A5M3M6W8_CONPW|nr:NAD(P)-binding protein [Coniophora puteana RWD-64-598 SS2]EIW74803.1 NAD(P)-binding protein [Coniophora puteana RWD-64-598 SS2]